MPSPNTRRRLLSRSALALTTILTGCLTDSQSDTPSNRTELSEAEAKEQALHAEETYLERQLSNASCLDDWGTTSTTARKSATVTDQTAEGVRVEVVHPYWFTETRTEEGSNKSYKSHMDGGSHAQYLVAPEDIERLSGDPLSPC